MLKKLKYNNNKNGTFENLSSKVLGSILGNNFNAIGNKNSIKGTIMKTKNGTSLTKSCVVRLS